MKAASDQVWRLEHELVDLKPGPHVVKIRLCHPNILLEKLLVDFGGLLRGELLALINIPLSPEARKPLDAAK